MAWEPTLYNWVNGTSGLVLAALGAWVLAVRPARRPTFLFGLLMIGFGLGYALNHLFFAFDWVEFLHWGITIPFWGGAAILAWWVMLQFPGPWPGDRRPLHTLITVGLTISMATLVVAMTGEWGARGDRAGAAFASAGMAGFILMVSSLLWLSCMLPIRYMLTEPAGSRRSIAIVGLAIGIYVTGAAGSGAFTTNSSIFSTEGPRVAWSAINLGVAAMSIGLWGLAASRDASSRAPWVVALTLAASTIIGLRVAYLGDEFFGLKGPYHGITRLVAFVVLAYGILHDRMLGADLRARAAIKWATMACAGLAAGWLAYALTEPLLADVVAMGLAIAAALSVTFVTTPLHHFADQVATRGAGMRDAEHAYRKQVEIAARNGPLGKSALFVLGRVQTKLDIPTAKARQIEAEVQRSLSSATG